jgi:hypothetical protein
MSGRRIHIVVPEQLVDEIDNIVDRRGRSRFIVQAAETALDRVRQIAAIEKATGNWKSRNHPELAQRAARWVSQLRKESDTQRDRFVGVDASLSTRHLSYYPYSESKAKSCRTAHSIGARR